MDDPKRLQTGFDRRDFLSALAFAAGTLAAGMRYADSQPASARPRDLSRFVDSISDVLIPGSSLQQPGTFLLRVIPHEFQGLTLAHLTRVADEMNKRSQGEFARADPLQRLAILTSLDDDAFAHRGDKDLNLAWTTLKLALLSVYYTSEKGASQDLDYIIVPGRWEPDIGVDKRPRALWSDTWARRFT